MINIHLHIGFIEFLIFVMYYIVLKAILLVLHVEAKRNNLGCITAVSGLLA